MTTQKEYLKNYLLEHKDQRIPIYKFVEMGIYRYGARFFDLKDELKNEGLEIESKEKRVQHALFRNQRQVEYRLVSSK